MKTIKEHFNSRLIEFFMLISTIDEFLVQETEIFTLTKELFRSMNSDDATEELYAVNTEQLKLLEAEFNTMYDITWQAVMEKEIQLFENIEDANTQLLFLIFNLLSILSIVLYLLIPR